MSTLIVGYGVVGKNMHRAFPEAWVVDPGLGVPSPVAPDDLCHALPPRDAERAYHEPPGCFEVAFVCVPTPPAPDGSCDASVVERAVRENEAEVYCIKSTVPPGTTDRLVRETGRQCVFSPEYYGATVHCNDYEFPFVILGGTRAAASAVAELYKEKHTGELRVMKTSARTAELVKYGENAFLATKVTFFNEFARMADAFGVDPDEFRELLLLDPRVGRSHSFSYRGHPFYDSACLNKDVPAIIKAAEAAGYRAPLLRAVRDINDSWRRP